MKLEAMPGSDQTSGTDAVRGIAVVALALVVGGYVAYRSDSINIAGEVETVAGASSADELAAASTEDDDEASSGGDEGGSVLDSGQVDSTTSTTAPEATTSTEAPATTPSGLRDPSEISIVVLNGSTVSGAAGRASETAEQARYQVLPPANAKGLTDSGIYYVEGFEKEALAVADVFGASLQVLVEPYEPAAPLADEDEPTGADIFVVLGNDGLIPIPRS